MSQGPTRKDAEAWLLDGARPSPPEEQREAAAEETASDPYPGRSAGSGSEWLVPEARRSTERPSDREEKLTLAQDVRREQTMGRSDRDNGSELERHIESLEEELVAEITKAKARIAELRAALESKNRAGGPEV